ncbi:hypothetical protein BC659_2393 [Sediminibacterium goheungense]|uniref:Uncharacterized protein n=1 Tax=Sediminibacterium goheungense TaxID=1086393 RepID=A0A4R6IYY3_9BACT|nr:hypothetical protein BC659_2393 [Sediminibacterium goheungense]
MRQIEANPFTFRLLTEKVIFAQGYAQSGANDG